MIEALPRGSVAVAETRWLTDDVITTWDEFHSKVRRKGLPLLARLDAFPDSVLVTGCQRSGTTMLSRIISNSHGMARYWFGPDDELDAALILSGYVAHRSAERHCFQTTYINDVREYRGRMAGHRIIWVLRQPAAVIHSMLHNWPRAALDRLFAQCGATSLAGIDAVLHRYFRHPGSFRRACLAYAIKISRLLELHQYVGERRMLVVDYDDLVATPDDMLARVYDFIGLHYDPRYAAAIRPPRTAPAHRLPWWQKRLMASLCEPAYQRARALIRLTSTHAPAVHVRV